MLLVLKVRIIVARLDSFSRIYDNRYLNDDPASFENTINDNSSKYLSHQFDYDTSKPVPPPK